MNHNHIIKYGNKFNQINFSHFNRTQANIFFAIISRLRNKGTKAVSLSYNYIANLSGIHYGHKVGKFDRELRRTYHNILHLTIFQNSTDRYTEISLFSKFTIDRKRKKVTIIINPYFSDLLNKLYNKFTRFPLRQYVVLRSRYAKTLFRFIKMFRISGVVILPIKKFRRILGIPKSYTGNMITQRVITPAKIQLTPLVRNLHIITIRNGYGKTITGYKITFKPDNPKYDKLVGFHKSNRDTQEWMKENIKLNPYLTKKQKRQAENNIQFRKKHKKRYSIPMKSFNKMLKTSNYGTLSWYYNNRKLPSIHFSEYQVRKLRKACLNKCDKEQLNKLKVSDPVRYKKAKKLMKETKYFDE